MGRTSKYYSKMLVFHNRIPVFIAVKTDCFAQNLIVCSSCANWLAFQFCVFSAVEVRMKYCFFKRNEELLKNSISFWCNAFLSTSYYVEGLFKRFSQFFHAHSFYKKNAINHVPQRRNRHKNFKIE